MQNIGPCTLVGEHVELTPIDETDVDDLLRASRGVDWTYVNMILDTRASVEHWVSRLREDAEKGHEFAFTVRVRPSSGLPAPEESSGVVGMTRYLDIQNDHKGVEIGGTWYTPRYQGTVVNPECKYLLLKHAFEDWGAIRVQLKTDIKNVRSQRAIAKLGAKFEGKLRNQRIRRDGSYRDSMMYSITKEEWPEVKRKLEERISSWKPV